MDNCSIRDLPDYIVQARDADGDRVIRDTEGVWRYDTPTRSDMHCQPVLEDGFGPFVGLVSEDNPRAEVLRKTTFESLSEVPLGVTAVWDEDGDRVNRRALGWEYENGHQCRVGEDGHGPYVGYVRVLASAVESTSDLETRVATLERLVSVLQEHLDKTNEPEKTEDGLTWYLDSVPVGINTVRRARPEGWWGEAELFHRLADGRWIFGTRDGYNQSLSGEIVIEPGDHRVTTV